MQLRLFGHAIHPTLVGFPLGLLTTSVLFDLPGYASVSHTAATASEMDPDPTARHGAAG